MLVIIIIRHEFALNRLIATQDARTHMLSLPNTSIKKKPNGCSLIIKLYTEDTLNIRRHKDTWNIIIINTKDWTL